MIFFLLVTRFTFSSPLELEVYVVRTKPTKPKVQTEKVSDLVWFGLKPIRTNRNRSSLVWFLVFHFEIRETDEPIRW